MRLYHYVGPIEIARRADDTQCGFLADSQQAVIDSLRSFDGYRDGESLTVTFTISPDGRLRIADQRSEHVACAGGEAVLSAGEMTFGCGGSQIVVERVTNQSTGYCPEPESWIHVSAALDRLSLQRPDQFDPALVFRRCPSCRQINVVKDSWFECDVCGTSLPDEWNFDNEKQGTATLISCQRRNTDRKEGAS